MGDLTPAVLALLALAVTAYVGYWVVRRGVRDGLRDHAKDSGHIDR